LNGIYSEPVQRKRNTNEKSLKNSEKTMRTDFEFPNKDLIGPVVFRPDFNRFEAIGSTQAWSLFFTAGQEDKNLGFNSEAGRFFTNLLIAVGVTGTIWASVFTSVR
jgi:hypothetical protein